MSTPPSPRPPLTVTPVATVLAATLAVSFLGWSAAVGLTPPPPATPVAAPAASSTPARSDPPNPVTPITTAAARTPSASPSPTAEPTEAKSAEPTVAGAAYPDVVVGEGQECGRFGTGPWAAVGTYNATTSCPFALNVRKAYLAAGLDGGQGTIQAYSPTTKKDYTMACSGSQPARCEGGVAARVMIYGGEFVLVTGSE